MTIEITEKKEEAPKPQVDDIKETLKAADEYQKLKEENDKMEAEVRRTEELNRKREELRAQSLIGGRSFAGTPEVTDEQKAQEEAKRILSMFE